MADSQGSITPWIAFLAMGPEAATKRLGAQGGVAGDGDGHGVATFGAADQLLDCQATRAALVAWQSRSWLTGKPQAARVSAQSLASFRQPRKSSSVPGSSLMPIHRARFAMGPSRAVFKLCRIPCTKREGHNSLGCRCPLSARVSAQASSGDLVRACQP